MKIGLKVVAGFIAAIIAVFVLELVGLGFFKFFEPKRENIRREVFENTKSYVHGKIQDLARYHREWQLADGDDKQAIESLIRSQFAAFDEQNITTPELKQFLQNVRGY